MRLVTTLAAITLFVIPTIAEAQQQRGRQGGGYSPPSRNYVQRNYRPNNNYYRNSGNYYRNNGNRYVQNNYYGGRGYGGGWNNGGAIAAGVGLGLLGGLIGGALINQPAYAAPVIQQQCFRQVLGYDAATGQTISQVVCN
jgi:hypothetical protein